MSKCIEQYVEQCIIVSSEANNDGEIGRIVNIVKPVDFSTDTNDFLFLNRTITTFLITLVYEILFYSPWLPN